MSIGNGIKLSTGFDVNASNPLDNRTTAASITERDAMPAINRYEGLIVYVLADKKNYQLVGGTANTNWVELQGGGIKSDTIVKIETTGSNNIVDFLVNGVVKSSIDKDGNFTGSLAEVLNANQLEYNYTVGTTHIELTHNLGRIPIVIICDENGNVVLADVKHINKNQLTLDFIEDFKGAVYLSDVNVSIIGVSNQVEYSYVSPILTTTLNHNLNRIPPITICDSFGNFMFAEIQYVDKNNIKIVFAEDFTGTIYLN